jgi:hypothetical protein
MSRILVAWALDHQDEYAGWDAKTLTAALRWNFDGDAEMADGIAERLLCE